MKRPSFFIAGNSKSGTTALSKFLASHPDLFMCTPKEPNYFAKDFCRDPDPHGSFHPRSEADYLTFFEPAKIGQICGEASACYLYSRVAAANIHAFNPEAKLILIFREPVDFLYSYYLQLLKNPVTEGERIEPFGAALTMEDARKAGRELPEGCYLPEFLFYSDRVKYEDQLKRIYHHFPRQQVLVLIYDDFKEDNAAVYRQVLSFLGVRTDYQPVFATYNTGAEIKSRGWGRLIRRITFGTGWARPLKFLIKRLLPQQKRKGLVAWLTSHLVYKPKQQLDENTITGLKARYRDEVVLFSKMIGRDLVTAWGYDSVQKKEAA